MIAKVGLSGATGRMGLEVAALLSEDRPVGQVHFELADAVSARKRLKSLEGVEVRTWDEAPREPVHVWIDFSRPESTMRLLEVTKEPVLIATTGFSATELSTICRHAETRAILLSSNTSLGMSMLFSLFSRWPGNAEWIKQVLVSEEHHAEKKDAPSGTAKTLVERLKGQGFSLGDTAVVRAGGIRGNHTVRFVGEHEEIEITHRAFDRRIFAEGALRAAAFLVGKKTPGIFSMEDFLKEAGENHVS